MKKFFKILLLIIAIALVSVALPYSPMLGERLTAQTLPTNQEVREGDIIFQTSKSRQSPLLQVATRSKITHCGIIVMREGKPCRFPEFRYSCMSAYCIYVKKLAEACGMVYDYKDGILPYFGMYVF